VGSGWITLLELLSRCQRYKFTLPCCRISRRLVLLQHLWNSFHICREFAVYMDVINVHGRNYTHVRKVTKLTWISLVLIRFYRVRLQS